MRVDLGSPVSFSIQIGDDIGETAIQLDGKGKFKQDKGDDNDDDDDD